MKFNIDDFMPKSFKTKLSIMLDRNRYMHSVGVACTAAYLAEKYKSNIKRAAIAGFLHDCAKGLSIRGMKKSIKKYNIKLDETTKLIPGLWHSIIAAYMAKDIFNIKDKVIFDAIKFHSTGREKMSNLAKIIYISDYIELGREYSSSKKTRKLIKDNKISLDEFVLIVLKEKLHYLINSSMIIHPDSIKLFNCLVN